MPMIKVYRFEDNRGDGCFNNGGAYEYNMNTTLEDDCYAPPGPFDENPSSSLHKHYAANGLCGMRFGFSSKASLRRWFTCAKGRRAMAISDNIIAVYEVPSAFVLKGDWQVIFDRDQARYVGKLNLTTLKFIEDREGKHHGRTQRRKRRL